MGGNGGRGPSHWLSLLWSENLPLGLPSLPRWTSKEYGGHSSQSAHFIFGLLCTPRLGPTQWLGGPQVRAGAPLGLILPLHPPALTRLLPGREGRALAGARRGALPCSRDPLLLPCPRSALGSAAPMPGCSGHCRVCASAAPFLLPLYSSLFLSAAPSFLPTSLLFSLPSVLPFLPMNPSIISY